MSSKWLSIVFVILGLVRMSYGLALSISNTETKGNFLFSKYCVCSFNSFWNNFQFPEHPGQCWIKDKQRALDLDQEFQPRGECVLYTCYGDFDLSQVSWVQSIWNATSAFVMCLIYIYTQFSYMFNSIRCSPASVPEGWRYEQDLTRPHPDCCGHSVKIEWIVC